MKEMNHFMKKISIMMVLTMVMVSLFSIIPSSKADARTAKNTYSKLYWYAMDLDDGSDRLNAQMAVTEKNLYLGDYIIGYVASTGASTVLSTDAEVEYTSSKKSVATIDSSTGRVTPVSTGTTVLTASVNGLSLQCKLKIVSSVKIDAEYSIVKSKASSFIKKIGMNGTITAENRYAIVNAYNAYLEAKTNPVLDFEDEGFVDTFDGVNTTASYVNDVYVHKNVIAMPIVRRANYLGAKVEKEIVAKCPIGTYPATLFESTAVKGQGTTVTMTLKNTVTADDIFGIKAAMSDAWGNYILEKSTATFPVYVKDLGKSRRYYAIATVKKGQKTLTIELSTGSLTAGRKYKIGYAYCGSMYVNEDWLRQGKVTFTAK